MGFRGSFPFFWKYIIKRVIMKFSLLKDKYFLQEEKHIL